VRETKKSGQKPKKVKILGKKATKFRETGKRGIGQKLGVGPGGGGA